jgi:hypothetical protein
MSAVFFMQFPSGFSLPDSEQDIRSKSLSEHHFIPE